MALSPENQATLAKDMRDSLVRAGVPTAYSERLLASCGKTGEQVRDWFVSDGKAELRAGKTVMVEGTDTFKALDLFFTLARASHVSGIGVRVMTPLSLAAVLESKDYEDQERIDKVPVLCLNPFLAPDDNPMSVSQRYRIQDLITERILGGKSHILLSYGISASRPWWATHFLDLVRKDSRFFRGAA